VVCYNSCDLNQNITQIKQSFRKTFAFDPDYHLNIRVRGRSTTDHILEAHRAEFEGKKGLSGFIWSDDAVSWSDPILVATMFPISPVVAGRCLCVTTKHSTFGYHSLQGHHLWNQAIYSWAKYFPLTMIKLDYPMCNHTCGFNHGGRVDNTTIYVSNIARTPTRTLVCWILRPMQIQTIYGFLIQLPSLSTLPFACLVLLVDVKLAQLPLTFLPV
jgi:hypothetical protein